MRLSLHRAALPQVVVRASVLVALTTLVPREAEGAAIIVLPAGGGAAARSGAPVGVELDPRAILGPDAKPERLRLRETTASGREVPVQLEVSSDPSKGILWFIPGPGPAGDRKFEIELAAAPAEVALSLKAGKHAGGGDFIDVAEGPTPVLRYNHGTVPVPEGIPPEFARGDYVSPLHGPSGEVLTADYPKDHPHHRGVGWSWPVTRWRDEVRDIWAVSGVWSRPVAVRRKAEGNVLALVEVENVWKWGDATPIVKEEVTIRAFRASADGNRAVDIEVRLTGLEDRVAIGGRPHAGYGGFGMRGAPAEARKITLRTDPPEASPRRSWLDYSGAFAGGKGRSGVAILEHPGNPLYPNVLQEYPAVDYVMPAFPAEREFPLEKGRTTVLRHRLWIHPGDATEEAMRDVWDAWAEPPRSRVAK